MQLWVKEAKLERQSSPAKRSSCGGVPARSVMATFEEQTECIVEALFSDLLGEDESACRSLETDLGGRVGVGVKNGWFAADDRGVLTEHLQGGCSLGSSGFLKCSLVMVSKLSLFWGKS